MPSPSESIAPSASAFEWMLNFRLMPAPDEDEDVCASEDDVDCARAKAQHDAKNATIATRKTQRRVADDVIVIRWWWVCAVCVVCAMRLLKGESKFVRF
jgi:hypothetical protein